MLRHGYKYQILSVCATSANMSFVLLVIELLQSDSQFFYSVPLDSHDTTVALVDKVIRMQRLMAVRLAPKAPKRLIFFLLYYVKSKTVWVDE